RTPSRRTTPGAGSGSTRAARPTRRRPATRTRRRRPTTSQRRRTPRIRAARAALVAGVAVLGLTTAAVLLAWPRSSPLEPRNGGHPNGESSLAWIFFVLLIAAFAAYVAGIVLARASAPRLAAVWTIADRKSTRLNSSHDQISY